MLLLCVDSTEFELVIGRYFVGGRIRLTAVAVSGLRIVLTWNVPDIPLDADEAMLLSAWRPFIDAAVAQGLFERAERYDDELLLVRLSGLAAR